MVKDTGNEKKDSFRFVHISTDEVYGSLGAEGNLKVRL